MHQHLDYFTYNKIIPSASDLAVGRVLWRRGHLQGPPTWCQVICASILPFFKSKTCSGLVTSFSCWRHCYFAWFAGLDKVTLKIAEMQQLHGSRSTAPGLIRSQNKLIRCCNWGSMKKLTNSSWRYEKSQIIYLFSLFQHPQNKWQNLGDASQASELS